MPAQMPGLAVQNTQDGLTPFKRFVGGIGIDVTDYEKAVRRILEGAREGDSGYVCAANVHMVMEAYDDPELRQVIDRAALVTPDGMPLVWALRLLGTPHASRVYGPDLMLVTCKAAEAEGIPVGLYGGTPESLDAVVSFLRLRFPHLKIVCRIAPPFRPLTREEDAAVTEKIEGSGVRILLVGIGCPKQEKWMARHAGQIPAVMLGVGAAFDFYSGRVRQAPVWMRKAGLEWFFRLLMEPRRLWKRYARHNPRFIWLLFREVLKTRLFLR